MAHVNIEHLFHCSECASNITSLQCDMPGCFNDMQSQKYIQCFLNQHNEFYHYCEQHSDKPSKQVELLPWDEEDERLANL